VLLQLLREVGNRCPVMMSSSVQATLTGRYAGSEYGKSKLAAEGLMYNHALQNDSDVLIYRLPNVFGKWCRPNYNSAVATFCHNVANGLPVQISDRSIELELVYIDDLIGELLDALEGRAHHEEDLYYYVPKTHRVTLGEIVDTLYLFRLQPQTLMMPPLPNGSFEKKLYSTYLSYLPREAVRFSLETKTDERGSFTELMRTADHGQFSVNVSRPGATKGQHWHNSKWELFIVVSGRALIRQRRLDSEEVLEFEVCGEHPEAVYMLPGYAHSIVNLSDTQDLVTLMWANEPFDAQRPDTYREYV